MLLFPLKLTILGHQSAAPAADATRLLADASKLLAMAILDLKKLEGLTNDVTHMFSEGLRNLSNQNLEVQKERSRLEEKRKEFERASREFEQEKAAFQEQKAHFEHKCAAIENDKHGGTASVGTASSRGGRDQVRKRRSHSLGYCTAAQSVRNSTEHTLHERSTLTRCSDSVLAAYFSGREKFEESSDESSRLLIDYKPELFKRLLNCEVGSADHQQGHVVDSFEHTMIVERKMMQLLSDCGLRGWIYRNYVPDPHDFSIELAGHRYAVLPPAWADESKVLLDMYDATVTVPEGWEVLTTLERNFAKVMKKLTRHGWGTSLLCVKNAEGGFSSYRTTLYTHGGSAGSCLSNNSSVLQALDSNFREFRFSGGMILSGRLVIRCK